MIEARKIRLFESVFEKYNRWLLRRRFRYVHVKGLSRLKEAVHPKLVCANHSSWWDGLLAFQLSRAAGHDAYCMMEERQLAGLRPFTWLGAFSVVREKPRDAIASVNYAATLLRESADRAVWIFPQGEIQPNGIRPLVFFRGLERIAEAARPVTVVPAAIRYEFLGGYKPEIFVSIGQPILAATESPSATEIASEVTELLDSIGSDILERRFDGYSELLR